MSPGRAVHRLAKNASLKTTMPAWDEMKTSYSIFLQLLASVFIKPGGSVRAVIWVRLRRSFW
jgi:hypothetical protein